MPKVRAIHTVEVAEKDEDGVMRAVTKKPGTVFTVGTKDYRSLIDNGAVEDYKSKARDEGDEDEDDEDDEDEGFEPKPATSTPKTTGRKAAEPKRQIGTARTAPFQTQNLAPGASPGSSAVTAPTPASTPEGGPAGQDDDTKGII